MCLRLPLFEELSEEQKNAFRLVGDKTILVTGPPGTGKSVIALFRAANVQKLGKDREPILLSFGKLLTSWTEQALVDACEALEADAKRVTVKTVDSWIAGTPQQPRNSWFFKAFGRPIPRLAPQRPGGYPPIDWEGAYAVAAAAPAANRTLDLIVDEAQDLDRNFWQIVLPYCRSCTVLCDTNQTLHIGANDNFSDRDFAAILGIEEGDEDHWAKLNINYRNSGNIVKAVNDFRPPVLDGKSVSLPDSTRPGPKPIIRHSGSFDDCVDHIAKVMVNYPQLSHGVLTSSTRDLTKVIKRLDKISTKIEFAKLQYQEYKAGAKNFDPCQPGILATFATNAKGLEFDYVYVIALQNWTYPLDTAARNRMYVCMTRARTNLEIMWDGNGLPPILDELPKKHFDHEKIV